MYMEILMPQDKVIEEIKLNSFLRDRKVYINEEVDRDSMFKAVYFLDRIVSKIFCFEGNAKITKYVGNYSEVKDIIKENEVSTDKAANKNKDIPYVNNQPNKKEKLLKFTFKEQREFDEIDLVISNLEEQIVQIQIYIGKAGSDFTLLQKLLKDKDQLEVSLEEKMERWMYLNEIAEKINQVNS